MAKVRKCKLRWKASGSPHVVGYKIYWSKSDRLSYDCKCVEVGNVTEAYLPDLLKDTHLAGEPVMLGITAVDRYGNESDMATLAEPYRVTILPPPKDFVLITLDTFDVSLNREALKRFETLFDEAPLQDDRGAITSEEKEQAGFGDRRKTT